MRTLKKSLCLVLAVVMILGLGVFNVNAQYTTKDYSDSKKISHGEAVDVLGAIGVLEGDDNDGDGKIDYRPEDKLTRAQATKIITSMLGVTAVTAVAPFADVGADVAWAKDYIAYCAEQGIVEGVDDENNLFDPQGELTGGAFAKMLLTAMGYDATIEGMAGTTSWLINVAKLVRNNDLDKGIANFPYDEPITRDDAAQLAFNALCAPLVEYDNKGGTMNVNGVTITTSPSTVHYMTTSVRDTQTISYALVNDGSTSGTYIVEFAEKYQPKLVRDTLDSDDFGRPCTTWTFNRVKLDTYVNESLRVAEWHDKFKESDGYQAIGGDLMYRLGNNSSAQSVDFDVYWNGEVDDLYSLAYLAALMDNDSGEDMLDSKPGRSVEFFIDDDVYRGVSYATRYSKITVVIVDTFLGEISAPVNSKGEAKVTFANEEIEDDFGGAVVTVKKDDVANVGDFKEGDRVLVQAIYPDSTSKREVKVIMPCEKVEDVYINAYTVDNGAAKMDSVTTDGTKYSVAAAANWDVSVLKDYTKRDLKGFTYDIYKDQYGNLIGIETNQTDTDYVFVTAITDSSGDYLSGGSAKASLIYTDGTMETKTVKLSDSNNASAKDYFNRVARVNGTNGTNRSDFWRATAANASSSTTAYGANGASRSWTGKTDGAIINRWFTYSKDDSGSITLRDCVGYNTTGNSKQVAVTMPVNESTKSKQEINSSNVQLPTGTNTAGTTTYAFGNDKSVYLAASLDVDPVSGGSINKITSVTTGIKNTDINLMDIAYQSDKERGTTTPDNDNSTFNNYALYYTSATADDTTYAFKTTDATTYTNKHVPAANPRQWNNVFFVYDAKTNYVLYAVAIAKSSAKDVLYITSGNADAGKTGVTKSEYVNGIGYVDTYTAIRNGEKVTVQVDRDKSNTNDAKMYGGRMYHVDYNAEGMIVDVEDAGIDNSRAVKTGLNKTTTMNTDTNKENRYVYSTNTTGLDLKGNTLYFGSAASNYLILNNQTRFFVAEATVDGEGDYDEYRSSTSAFTAATNNGNAISAVFAECDKDTGFAKSVIFITNGTADSSSTYSKGIVDVILPFEFNEDATVGGVDVKGTNTAIVLYNGIKPSIDEAVENVTEKLLAEGRVVTKVTMSGSVARLENEDAIYGTARADIFVDRANTVVNARALEGSTGTLSTGSTNFVVTENQTVTVYGNVTIATDLYVNGTLYVPSGATLTVGSGAGHLYVTENGHIVVGGNMTVNGEPYVAGSSIVINKGGYVYFNGNGKVTGALTVNGSLKLGGVLTLNDGAEMTVNDGAIVDATTTNNIVVNSGATYASTSGAEFTVAEANVLSNQGGTITSKKAATYTTTGYTFTNSYPALISASSSPANGMTGTKYVITITKATDYNSSDYYLDSDANIWWAGANNDEYAVDDDVLAVTTTITPSNLNVFSKELTRDTTSGKITEVKVTYVAAANAEAEVTVTAAKS